MSWKYKNLLDFDVLSPNQFVQTTEGQVVALHAHREFDDLFVGVSAQNEDDFGFAETVVDGLF